MSRSDSSVQRSGVTAGRVIVGLLVVLLVVFAVLNRQDVRMHWVVGTTDTPLILLILGFALLGMVVGYFVGRRPKGRE